MSVWDMIDEHQAQLAARRQAARKKRQAAHLHLLPRSFPCPLCNRPVLINSTDPDWIIGDCFPCKNELYPYFWRGKWRV